MEGWIGRLRGGAAVINGRTVWWLGGAAGLVGRLAAAWSGVLMGCVMNLEVVIL